MKGAFVTSSITEETDDHVVRLAVFAGESDARGDRDIAANDGIGRNGTNGDVAGVHRTTLAMTATVAFCIHLTHHGLNGYALCQIVAGRAVCRGHVIARAQIIKHADGAGLLPVRLMDASRDSPFEEEEVDPFLILPDQDHRLVHA